jgi:hypothetical protein
MYRSVGNLKSKEDLPRNRTGDLTIEYTSNQRVTTSRFSHLSPSLALAAAGRLTSPFKRSRDNAPLIPLQCQTCLRCVHFNGGFEVLVTEVGSLGGAQSGAAWAATEGDRVIVLTRLVFPV